MKKVVALEWRQLVKEDERFGNFHMASRAISEQTAQVYMLLLDFAEKKGWRFIQNDSGEFHNKYIFQTQEEI